MYVYVYIHGCDLYIVFMRKLSDTLWRYNDKSIVNLYLEKNYNHRNNIQDTINKLKYY